MAKPKLCPTCTTIQRTHRAGKRSCTGGARQGFNNCFDRNHVKALEKETDADILRGIISSNALSMNNTDASKRVTELRLKQIIATHLEPTPKPGVCQYCGCTEDDPCYLPVDDSAFVSCAWFDSAQTVCSNARCIDKHTEAKPRPILRDEFLCGAALVLGSMIRDHAEKQVAQMIMRGHGITYDQLKAGGVDEYDLKEIRRIK